MKRYAGLVFVVLIGIAVLVVPFAWERYRYTECLKVGHAKAYCLCRLVSE